MKKIIIFNQWFCKPLPNWLDKFIDRVLANPNLNFCCITDQKHPESQERINFFDEKIKDYVLKVQKLTGELISDKSGGIASVDLRPLISCAYPNLVEDYEFWGWCDLDIVIGNISSFINQSILDKWDIFTTRRNPIEESIYGAFTIVRNCEEINQLWRDDQFIKTIKEPFVGAIAKSWSPIAFKKQAENKIKIWCKDVEGKNPRFVGDKLLDENKKELLYHHFRPKPKIWPEKC